MVFKLQSYGVDGTIFCSWHFTRMILRQLGDYRAHYVNRFRDLLAVQ